MVETIQRERLKKRIDEREDFYLIEVLAPAQYDEGHIPGAINIPVNEIDESVKERFKPDADIVVYCASKECQASPKAAKRLEELGFTSVKDFEGGKKDWTEAGYSLVKD